MGSNGGVSEVFKVRAHNCRQPDLRPLCFCFADAGAACTRFDKSFYEGNGAFEAEQGEGVVSGVGTLPVA